jgi:hypothetical protein
MMGRQKWALAGVVLFAMTSTVVLVATTAQLHQITASDIVTGTWATGSVTWVLNPTNTIVYTGSTTLATESDLSTLLTGAFSAWSGASIEGKAANALSFSPGGTSTTNSSFYQYDCVNTIGFTQDLSTGIIGETEVEAITTGTPGSPLGSYTQVSLNGGTSGKPFGANCNGTCPYQACIIDADIEFSTAFQFFTPAYTTPPPSYFDLTTVATHEVGHMIGLDHSGIASAMMWPFGDTGGGGVKSALETDDAIGSYILYPNTTSGVQSLMGEIDGNVEVASTGVFGAHVAAVDQTTGNVITDTLTDMSGNYKMPTVAGTYTVVLLPLALDSLHGPVNISNFSGYACGYQTGNPCVIPAAATDFTATTH